MVHWRMRGDWDPFNASSCHVFINIAQGDSVHDMKKTVWKILIVGHYRDYYQTKQSVYLGYSYEHAQSRLNYVKSDLWKNKKFFFVKQNEVLILGPLGYEPSTLSTVPLCCFHPKTRFFHFLQSYWDWLPPEIQEHIVSLAWWQSVRDQRNPLKSMFRELSNYHALKVAWNKPPVVHGRIRISHKICIKRCPNNCNMDLPDYSLYCDGKTCTMTHSCIWATYTMENIGQYEVFLGHNFPKLSEE